MAVLGTNSRAACFSHFHSFSLTPLRNQLLKKKTPRANRRRERPSRIHELALTVLKSQKQGQFNEPSTGILRGRSLGERGARFQKSMGKVWNGFWLYFNFSKILVKLVLEQNIFLNVIVKKRATFVCFCQKESGPRVVIEEIQRKS